MDVQLRREAISAGGQTTRLASAYRDPVARSPSTSAASLSIDIFVFIRRHPRGQVLVDADEIGASVGFAEQVGDGQLARHRRVVRLELDGLNDL